MLRRINKANWADILFPIVLMVELLVYHWLRYDEICGFGSGLLIRKVLTVCAISGILLPLRRHAARGAFVVLLAIWIHTNLIYFRANGINLSYDAIVMVDNMSGFWASILPFFSWKDLLIWIPVGLYLPLCKGKRVARFWAMASVLIIGALLGTFWGNYQRYRSDIGERTMYNTHKGFKWYLYSYRPVYDVLHEGALHAKHNLGQGFVYYSDDDYIRTFSIADYVVWNIGYALQYHITLSDIEKQGASIELSDDEQEQLDACIIPSEAQEITPNSNLVFILFESLESWIFEDWPYAESIAPNLRRLIASPHSLYASKLQSQVRQGASGDGQMISLTGLLPLQSGAACMLFGKNNYPGWAHCYEESWTINPCPGTWNQTEINPSYGIKRLIEIPDLSDEDVISQSIAEIEGAEEPFFQLLLTTASHSPFNTENYPTIPLPEDMPDMLKRYATCVHYTDACIGRLIDSIQDNPQLSNTTIVIAGDHTIFKEPILKGFESFAKQNGISIQNGKNYIPLIICSPQLEQQKTITQECYQMDIYPTIASIIGCSTYFWQGLGVDLQDSAALQNRAMDEETAFELSNKIIRSDYFKNHQLSTSN